MSLVFLFFLSSPTRSGTQIPNWKIRDAGGRKYWLDIRGRQGWKARYVKEVDADEVTVRFYQEIYDKTGRLVEIHDKYPIDYGHQKVEE